MTLEEKFKLLEADNAPGQEVRQSLGDLKSMMIGEKLDGIFVDFSHGDVDAFPSAPAADSACGKGFCKGGKQAYTEYRGDAEIRKRLSVSISKYTNSSILAENAFSDFFEGEGVWCAMLAYVI